MKVAVVRETRPDEQRVALVPDAVSRLAKAGLPRGRCGGGAGLPRRYRRGTGRAAAPTEQIARLSAHGLSISFLPPAQELALIAVVRDHP